jgi:hypothetical protein
MRTGALFAEPIASIWATVCGGTGVKDLANGERLDSSQPAKNPPPSRIKVKEGTCFTKEVRRMDIGPLKRIVTVRG